MSRFRGTIVGVLAAVMLSLVGLAAAPAANASLVVRVVNTGGDGISSRSGPQLAARNGYGAPEGAVVSTVCWTWGDAVGPYNNRLWWLISYAGRRFYAADRYLSTPTVANRPVPGEPQCGASAAPPPPSSAQGAINWARARNGQYIYQGYCLLFVYDAYRYGGGKNIGTAPTAYNWWTARPGAQHRGDTNPPAGALVFWGPTRYNSAGHVALSLGGGQVISSQERASNQIHTFAIASRNAAGYPYLGWIMP